MVFSLKIFRNDIEGLRGIAVLLVVLYHAGVGRALVARGFPVGDGGFVGVDVFFVLSGYLIIGKLASAPSFGLGELAAFLSARVRRLAPAANAVALLTLVAVVLMAPKADWRDAGVDATASSLLVANYQYGLGARSYAAIDALDGYFIHFWSLNVEEQFYLFFAFGLVVASLRRRPTPAQLGAALVLLAALSAGATLFGSSGPLTYYGTGGRVWQLALGGLAALSPPLAVGNGLCGFVGLAAISLSAVTANDAAWPDLSALAPTVGTVMVLKAGERPAALGAVLGARPLRFVGRISYAWYLTHWPCLALAATLSWALERPTGGVVVVAVVTSFLLATILHIVVEQPLRRSPWLLSPRRALAVWVASTAAVIVVAQTAIIAADRGGAATDPLAARRDRPHLVPAGCERDYVDTEAVPCELGVEGVPTVVVIGDSHAAQLAPAFDEALRVRGLSGALYTKASCPPYAVRRWLNAYGRVYDECLDWQRDVVTAVQALSPVVVVVARHGNYLSGLVDTDDVRLDTPQAVDAWRSAAIAFADDVRGASVVVVRDTPLAGFDVPRCLSAKDPARCRLDARSVRWDAQLFDAEIEALGDVAVIDLNDDICPPGLPCESLTPEGVIKMRDGNHLTATYARTLSTPLGAALDVALVGHVNGPHRRGHEPP